MGEALLVGLLDAGWAVEDISVAEPATQRRLELEARFPQLRVVPAASWAVAEVDDVVIAVKPTDVAAALESARAVLGPATLLVSIAAGVTIEAIELLAPGHPVVRAMPNMPALVGQGAAALAPGSLAEEDHLRRAERILGAVGLTVRVGEKDLDGVTGLSGSGPAYIFLVVEALVEGGVLVGLPRDVAEQLVVQTLQGSAALLASGQGTAAQLREAVTSPGGTTAAGLRALERAGFRAALLEAVAEATRRSKELGSG